MKSLSCSAASLFAFFLDQSRFLRWFCLSSYVGYGRAGVASIQTFSPQVKYYFLFFRVFSLESTFCFSPPQTHLVRGYVSGHVTQWVNYFHLPLPFCHGVFTLYFFCYQPRFCILPMAWNRFRSRLIWSTTVLIFWFPSYAPHSESPIILFLLFWIEPFLPGRLLEFWVGFSFLFFQPSDGAARFFFWL